MPLDLEATVLIVDDDDMVRDSLKALLEAHRIQVQDFGSAKEYLAYRNGKGPRCLVLDMHMPEIGGLELLQRLRESGDSIPVVAITGRNDPVLEARAKALGASAVLDKPISHKVLFAAINQALAARPS
jgi:FixJ family two-component response regulator